MDIDLEIDNYNYNELLNLFHLPDVYHIGNIHLIQERLKVIKTNFSQDIYHFFLKSSKIITCMYELLNLGFVSNLNNTISVQKFVEKIKDVNRYESYDPNDLAKVVTKTSDKRKQREREEDFDLVNSISNDFKISTKAESVMLPPNRTQQSVETSFDSQVVPGNLNSVRRVTQVINLNLNSCFRSNYYSSNPCDFQYQIPTEIKNVVSMRLASIEIPNIWYLFTHSKRNNYFIMEIKANGKSTKYNIVVPDGNYDSDTLQHYLNTTYFFESDTTTELKYIKFSIDSYNFKTKIEFLKIKPENMLFSLIFNDEINQNIMNMMGWTIGFRLANYLDIVEFVQSEGLFDAGGDRYIYMAINDYQYNNNISNIVGFDKSISNEDIIAKIPVVDGKLALIIDDNTNPLTKTRKYNGPVQLSKIHVKILDKFGRLIDFNNMDFSFTLELELLYENFNFSNVTG